MTRIWLVADDYGISRSVNGAIRDLIARRRLSGTSVMMPAPGFDGAEAALLADAAARGQAAVGLHLTLTAPFRPLTPTYRPIRDNAFPSLRRTLASGLTGFLDTPSLVAEIRAQLAAFAAAFGRPPDFVDGHQHVHILPPVADALLPAMRELAPEAWVRQCGLAPGMAAGDLKARVLDFLSVNFRARAARLGVPTNAGFAGTYDFSSGARYDSLFPKFLDGIPEGGLIMCHPGVVDDELRRLDPLTTLREQEYAYFKSDAFAGVLAERGVSLR